MEERFDRVTKAVRELSDAVGLYASVQADLTELERYMSSGEWLHDFEADEAGLLPAKLKRGVLSEDGLWNLLADNRDLLKELDNLRRR